MLVRFIFLILLMLQISCAQKNEKSYQDLFALRILLENATKARPNPQAACIEALRSEETCVVTASDVTTGAITEATFSFQLSAGRFTTYSDLCANNLYMYPLPANFTTNYSDAVRECYFKCDSSYWKTRKNLNTCNGTVAIMTTGIFNDSGTTTCKRNCSSAINNTP